MLVKFLAAFGMEFLENYFSFQDLPKHLKKLYVGNLGCNITARQLKNYFDSFAEVENVFIGRKKIQR